MTHQELVNSLMIKHILRTADLMSTTAWYLISRKATGKNERFRQYSLCIEQRNYLQNLQVPDILKSEKTLVIKRLNGVISFYKETQ